MPRNSAGTYSLPAGNPVVSGTVIASTWANNTLSDISTALTGSLSRSGQGAMQAQLQLTDGAVGTPALSFASEVNGGLYRAGAGDFRISISANDVLKITSSVFTVIPKSIFTGVSSGSADGYSVNIDSTIPGIFFNDSDAAANTKGYYFLANAGSFQIGLYNDAFTSSAGLVFNRTAGAWTSINIGNTTDNPTFNFLGVGIATISGRLAVGGAFSSGVTPTIQAKTSAANAFFSANDGTIEGLFGSDTVRIVSGAFTNHGFDLRTNNTTRVSIASVGSVVINAPASGNTLTITAVSGSAALQVTGAGSTTTAIFNGGGGANGNLESSDSGRGSIWTFGRDNVSTGSFIFAFNATKFVTIAQAGNVTINAPASGNALTVNAVAGSGISAAVFNGSTTAGGRGITVLGGTASTDFCAVFQNATGGTNLFLINGDGGVQVASPTGGDKGLGTINVSSGYYLNGVAISASGSFTGTLTGMTAGTTGTVSYTVTNGLVCLYLAAQIQGTSNTTAMTMTGLPAAVQPTSTRTAFSNLQNNSGGLEPGVASVTAGTITFSVPLGSTAYDPNGFTASNLKGLFAGWTFIYPL